LLFTVAASCVVHLLMVTGETTLTHVTAHARLAQRNMTHGRYAIFFWTGAALIAVGVAAPWLGAWSSLIPLVGLLAHEHAYVQSAQSVPLA
jgi:hypothetical protein